MIKYNGFLKIISEEIMYPYDDKLLEKMKKTDRCKFYFCNKLKINFFVIDYFPQGDVHVEKIPALVANMKNVENIAHDFCEATGFDFSTMNISIIKQSHFMKDFKVLWSSTKDQIPFNKSLEVDGFWEYVK